MRLIYVVHIVAGSLGLLSGYTALYSAKGAVLHRKSGMVFVYAMLTMAVAGTTISAIRNVAPLINIPAGLLTSYLVITSLITVRPLPFGTRSLSVTLMLLALAVGLTDLTFAAKTFVGPTARWTGIPLLMFASVGILGSAGDFRVLRAGPLRGSARIARHLWRMSFALFIAALSFFIGQAKVIPKPIRIMPLLVLPVIAVLITMLYWLWRVRVRRATYGQVFGSGSHVHRFPSHVG
jgi:uncharacterized membrane protein